MRIALAIQALALAVTCTTVATAQNASPPRRAAAQPRVIVIPFVKEGEDIKTVLDADFSRQVAIAKVKEAFDARGFSTIDFVGAVNVLKRDAAMAMASESDFRDALLVNNRADIYVIANFQPAVSGNLMSVMVILDAYMTANGLSLATKTGGSNRNQSTDVARHVSVVLDEIAPSFLDVMQAKFDQFQTEGVPLSVVFRRNAGATVSFTTKPQGKPENLADLIENFVETVAVNGDYAVTLSTENILQFGEMRVAIREANGAAVSPRRIGSRIVNFLETLGVAAGVSVSNGAIYVDLK